MLWLSQVGQEKSGRGRTHTRLTVNHLVPCLLLFSSQKGPLGKHAGKAKDILHRDTARVGLPLWRAGRGESQDNFTLD